MARHRPFRENDGATDVLPPRADKPVVGAVLRIDAPSPVERPLRTGTVRVGSGPDNDIVVSDRTVSRLHAAFAITPEGVLVEDLGSRNGTFYLGSRIGKLVVGLGARVQLGSITVAVEPDTEALLERLEYPGDGQYRGMLGTSSRIRKLFALLQRLEGSLATVLVEGESGVGKEEIARVIHEGSAVHGGPFVIVNCGAIPRELVASELFGHRRGAFTGAVESRRGAFESADGGTLFLDEIGELPLDVQPSLLRALEVGEIRQVGVDQPRHVKVRVIAATNRDLEAEAGAGRFRRDLFYRLAVVRINAPPLRGRPEDVELLAHHFARAANLPPLSSTLLEELKARPWYGNVRELRNAIQSYAAVGELPRPTGREGMESWLEVDSIDPTEPYQVQKDRAIEVFTKAYIRSLLRYTNGNQAAAARIGQFDRTYLGRLMTKYGLHVRKVD